MLSKPSRRDLKHNRTIEGKGFKREDGLWDIEVFLLIAKGKGFKREDGLWDIEVFLLIAKPIPLTICIENISVPANLCMIWH